MSGEMADREKFTAEVAKEKLYNASTIRSETIADVVKQIGETFVSEEIEISQDKLKAFLEATGDTNPIHFDEKEAKKSVFADAASGEVVVPGFLTLSLCANEKVLYEALVIDEPHEVVALGIKDVGFLAPVPVNSRVTYQYQIKSAKERTIKSRSAVIVDWDITVSMISETGKKTCVKVLWTLAYISLAEGLN